MSDDATSKLTGDGLAPRLSVEMRARAVSGAVLGTLALATAIVGPYVFSVTVGLVAAIMAWEWGRVVRDRSADVAFAVHVVAIVGAVVFTLVQLPLAGWLIGLAAVVLVLLWRWYETSGRIDWLSALGVPVIVLPAAGMVWFRDSAEGLYAVLFIFVCVWAHDISAMLTGRALGGPLLWPRLSPQKTWSGVFGGLIASTLAGAVFSISTGQGSWLWLGGIGFVIGAAAVVGDLAESSFKRARNVKNTSNLIPGHGGFLDRMDAASAGIVLAMIVAGSINAGAPARALLFGG